MKLRNVLLLTAAIGGSAATGLFLQAPMPLVSPAQAETNVSVNIDIGTFYDRLASHGSWVSYDDDYVWVPRDIAADWRPYTIGHWVYTKKHGWYWASDEPFGWAVYHYGRWGYDDEIGWYWVPGRKWAPAWVAWSRTDRAIAWAPLPPRRGRDRGDDVEINVSINIGDVPDIYWQAVPVDAFLEDDLSRVIIRERPRVIEVVRQGEVRPVRIENNIVVNNVIDVDFIEQRTNREVRVVEERVVENPDEAGRVDDNSVAIFNADVEAKEDAKPKEVVQTQEVKKRRAERVQEGDVQPGTAERPSGDEVTPDTATTGEEPDGKVKPSTADSDTTDVQQQATEQPAKKKAAPSTAESEEPGDDQTTTKRDRKEAAPTAAESEEVDGERTTKTREKRKTSDEAVQTQKDGEKVKKRKANEPSQEADPAATTGSVDEPDQSAEPPVKKRKKPAQASDQQGNNAGPEEVGEEAGQQANKRQRQAEPSADEGQAAEAPKANREKPKKRLPVEGESN